MDVADDSLQWNRSLPAWKIIKVIDAMVVKHQTMRVVEGIGS